MRVFQDDDEGYKSWLVKHPEGYVIASDNTEFSFMLHRATCPVLGAEANPTAAGYYKICSLNKDRLVGWVFEEAEKTPDNCTVCNP